MYLTIQYLALNKVHRRAINITILNSIWFTVCVAKLLIFLYIHIIVINNYTYKYYYRKMTFCLITNLKMCEYFFQFWNNS